MSTNRRSLGDGELYSISQVNALTGVSAPTLRKWEAAFREYLKVVRTRGGQHRFNEHAVRKIETLKRLIYEEGLSLHGAQTARTSRERRAGLERERTRNRKTVSNGHRPVDPEAVPARDHRPGRGAHVRQARERPLAVVTVAML